VAGGRVLSIIFCILWTRQNTHDHQQSLRSTGIFIFEKLSMVFCRLVFIFTTEETRLIWFYFIFPWFLVSRICSFSNNFHPLRSSFVLFLFYFIFPTPLSFVHHYFSSSKIPTKRWWGWTMDKIKARNNDFWFSRFFILRIILFS